MDKRKEKIDIVQIGNDGSESLSDAFVKEGLNVSVMGFKERYGAYVFQKTPEIEYYAFGKVNLRRMPSTTHLLDIRDFSDPERWRLNLESILCNENVQIPMKEVEDSSHSSVRENLKKYKEDYIEFKKILKRVLCPEYLFLAGDCQMYATKKMFNANDVKPLSELIGMFYHLVAVEVIDVTRARLEKDDLTEAEELNERGDILNEQGDYEGALPYLENALKLSPNFCLALVNKGIALKNLGKLGEAVSCYDIAIRANPEYKKAWHNKAVALYCGSQFDKSEECMHKALEIDPNYAIALRFKEDLF